MSGIVVFIKDSIKKYLNNENHYIKGNEFSLLIGAPNSDNGGSIHFATVDRYDSTKTYLVKVSLYLYWILQSIN